MFAVSWLFINVDAEHVLEWMYEDPMQANNCTAMKQTEQKEETVPDRKGGKSTQKAMDDDNGMVLAQAKQIIVFVLFVARSETRCINNRISYKHSSKHVSDVSPQLWDNFAVPMHLHVAKKNDNFQR